MYNKAILIGRLCNDPEMKTTPSGISVATFRIAVSRHMKDKKTDFLNIVCWRQTAEFVCNYFHKGDSIGVEGQIQSRDYTDKQGNKRHAVEIVADCVFFVSGKPNNDSNVNTRLNNQTPQNGDFQVVDYDSDLPF